MCIVLHKISANIGIYMQIQCMHLEKKSLNVSQPVHNEVDNFYCPTRSRLDVQYKRDFYLQGSVRFLGFDCSMYLKEKFKVVFV